MFLIEFNFSRFQTFNSILPILRQAFPQMITVKELVSEKFLMLCQWGKRKGKKLVLYQLSW